MRESSPWAGGAVLALGFVVFAAPAAAWQTEWQTTLGGSGDSGAACLALTSDGNVVTAGSLSVQGDPAFGVALLDGGTGNELWRYTSDGGGAVDVTVVGDQAIAAGRLETAAIGVAVAIDTDTGVPVSESRQYMSRNAGDMIWGSDAGPTPGSGGGVDVVTAGQVTASSAFATRQFHVDLRRSTTVIWERYIAPFEALPYHGPGAARDVVLHPGGDVIAIGEVHEIDTAHNRFTDGGRHIAVVRLARETGAVVWQHVVTEYSAAYRVALDSAGDVVVAGHIAVGSTENHPDFWPRDMIVLKLDSDDGAELWRTTIDSGVGGPIDSAYTVAIDADDNVIAAGRLQTAIIDPYWDVLFNGGVHEMSIIKLAGSDGAEIWRRLIPNTVTSAGNPLVAGVYGRAESIAVSSDGSVVAAGTVDGDPIGAGPTGYLGTFTVVRLDGDDGDVQWLQPLLNGNARAVAIDDDDAILAAGRQYQYDEGDNDKHDLVVVKFSDLIGGASLDLRDSTTPQRRRLDLKSKDRMLHAPVAGSVADPSRAGARLIVTDLTTGDATTYDLPKQYWSARGRGYKYLDRSGAGPCAKLTLRQGRLLKLKCRGAGIDTSPARGNGSRIAVKLELGPTNTVRYCMEFGDNASTDQPGNFEADGESAPSQCSP